MQRQSSLGGPAQTLANLYQMARVSTATYFNQIGNSGFNLSTGLGTPEAARVVQALVSGWTANATSNSISTDRSQPKLTFSTQAPGHAVQAAAIAERVNVATDVALVVRPISVVAGSDLAGSPLQPIISAQAMPNTSALVMTAPAPEATTGIAAADELSMQSPLDGRSGAEGVITLGANSGNESPSRALADLTFSVPDDDSRENAACLLNEESLNALNPRDRPRRRWLFPWFFGGRRSSRKCCRPGGCRRRRRSVRRMLRGRRTYVR